MKISSRIYVCSVFAGLVLLLAGISGGDMALAEQLLPEGFVTAEKFKPGIGAPVGEVHLVQGDVVLIHADKPATGYRAMKGLLLYKGDSIVTLENGKVNLLMKDGSTMTLASGTRLIINESIFDPGDKKNRTSFVSQTSGKVRFWIRKMLDFNQSDFKVKTKTAVVGVRGSDFIVEATDTMTRVTALENTRLEIVSLFVPCQKDDMEKKGETEKDCNVQAALLSDFEQAVIEENSLPEMAGEVIPEDIDAMTREFVFGQEASSGTDRQPGDDEVIVSPEDTSGVVRPADGDMAPSSDAETGIRISDDQLVPPESAGPDVIGGEEPEGPDRRDSSEEMLPDETVETPDNVSDDQREDVLEQELKELPDFPGNPRQ